MSKNIKMGMLVRVTDNGQSFATYKRWADENGLTQYDATRPKNGLVGTVVAEAPHHNYNWFGTLYGVEVDGKQFIIGEKGLEVVERTSLPDVFQFRTWAGVYRMTQVSKDNYICTECDEVYVKSLHYAEWDKGLILAYLNDGTWTFVKDITPPEPELPGVFEFYHGDNKEQVYTADTRGLTEDESVHVTWTDARRCTKEDVTYKLSECKSIVKAGRWVITKDVTEQVTKKEAFEATEKALKALKDTGDAFQAALKAYIDASKAL